MIQFLELANVNFTLEPLHRQETWLRSKRVLCHLSSVAMQKEGKRQKTDGNNTELERL